MQVMARVRGARDERASDVHREGTDRDKNRYFFAFLCFGQAEYTGFCGDTVGSMSFQLIDPQFFVTGVRTKK